MLVVALVGIAVNLDRSRASSAATATRTRTAAMHHGHDHDRRHDHDHDRPPRRSLNVEGSYQHILTDLFGFTATAVAAIVILMTGFHRADAIASLLIAAVMLHASYGLLRASVRVMMEAAPEGIDPDAIGRVLAAQAGVTEVHDLHIWEVTSGFPAISAHVVVDAGHDCHEVRRALSRLLEDRFGLAHSTLQVEHARAAQPPLQIEVHRHARQRLIRWPPARRAVSGVSAPATSSGKAGRQRATSSSRAWSRSPTDTGSTSAATGMWRSG